ncbi:MAG: hypothetical protein DWQ05_00385 [Calditrichaeota bacterium]|nr:MAG: hypothetical protein DWQ05_00385 [Calditrichota bacterium]
MSRSSIFNFETLQIPRKGLFTQAAKLTIAGLLLCELAIRLTVPAGQIPTGSWYNHTIRLQNAKLHKLEKIDIYFIGTSISCVNIPPKAFDEVLENYGIKNSSFNAGIAGPDFVGVAAAMKHLYWPQKQAKTAVLVVAPNDLNSANIAVRERTQAYAASFEQPAFAAATVDFLSHFWLFGFRKELKAWPKKGWQFDAVDVGSQGFTPLPNLQRRRWQTDYRIEPDGPVAAALFDLIDWLSERDVSLILINGLSEPAEITRIPQAQLDNFEIIMARCAAQNRVKYVDVSSINPVAVNFVDQLHIYEDAAKIYARQLAYLFISEGVLQADSK